MILQKEIRNIAESKKVPANTIDKDYVLGHFLNTLFSHDWAQDSFLFKGGTCLKKCYFEDYRFSEDIDITITNPEFTLSKKLVEEVCKEITSSTDIRFNILKFEDQYFNDLHVGWNVAICFWGANHSKNEAPRFGKDCHTKIEFDFRNYEQVIFADSVNNLKIIHPYSDHILIESYVPCYTIEEILSEKLRALIQRNRGEARDYFDIWYIKNNSINVKWSAVKDAFLSKCNFKNIEFTSIDQFFVEERLKQVEITYKARLNHQLPFEVDIINIIDDLKLFLPTIFTITNKL